MCTLGAAAWALALQAPLLFCYSHRILSGRDAGGRAQKGAKCAVCLRSVTSLKCHACSCLCGIGRRLPSIEGNGGAAAREVQ